MDEQEEQDTIRTLLERVQAGEVSVDEAMPFLWIKPVHRFKEKKYQLRIKKLEKLVPPPKKKPGRPKSKESAQKQDKILNDWIFVFWSIEMYFPPKPAKKIRKELISQLADKYHVDESTIWKYAVTPVNKFKKHYLDKPCDSQEEFDFWEKFGSDFGEAFMEDMDKFYKNQ